ncbi:hypothetical protein FM125_08155 [Micrococcus lylae]|uniref:Uncharacterized protein n=1 Tax=Micrococcus lylae TaxID=1273 RepID=A0A1R4JEX8_9MICC|nr:hypothetical protein FM125_08155 [Micrococcus lylae]
MLHDVDPPGVLRPPRRRPLPCVCCCKHTPGDRKCKHQARRILVHRGDESVNSRSTAGETPGQSRLPRSAS